MYARWQPWYKKKGDEIRGSNRKLERMRKKKAIMWVFPNGGEERKRNEMIEDRKEYEATCEQIKKEFNL